LILATLATAAGLDRRIGPFVALYVLILAVLGPLLTARSRWLVGLRPFRGGSGRSSSGTAPAGSLLPTARDQARHGSP
jgi:hypothetical protein